MPIATTRAFVLGTSVLSEQDKLVHLLTDNQGIIRGIAPGSLKAGNRFGSLFELFTEGEFHYYWKETRELITISKGEILTSYFPVVSAPENIFYFYLIADVYLNFVPFVHHNNRLYRLVNTILLHRQEGVDMDLLLLYFLIWVLRIEGMMFEPHLCYNCYTHELQQAWLKSDYQGIVCAKCLTGETVMLQNNELNYIQWTEHHPPKESHIWKNHIDTQKLIRAFTRKIQFHGECTLKSTQFLPEFR